MGFGLDLPLTFHCFPITFRLHHAYLLLAFRCQWSLSFHVPSAYLLVLTTRLFALYIPLKLSPTAACQSAMVCGSIWAHWRSDSRPTLRHRPNALMQCTIAQQARVNPASAAVQLPHVCMCPWRRQTACKLGRRGMENQFIAVRHPVVLWRAPAHHLARGAARVIAPAGGGPS